MGSNDVEFIVNRGRRMLEMKRKCCDVGGVSSSLFSVFLTVSSSLLLPLTWEERERSRGGGSVTMANGGGRAR